MSRSATKQALIRVDASSEIGWGHFYRCWSLALMLENTFEVAFVYKQLDQPLVDQVKQHGWRLEAIANDFGLDSLLLPETLVVLDGYHFSAELQVRLKEKGASVLLIDDFARKRIEADLVINTAPGLNPENFDKAKDTRLLLGLDYALLRPPFLKEAATNWDIPQVAKGGPYQVYLNFGGSDPQNFTKHVLLVLLSRMDVEKISVVVGGGYQHMDVLDKIKNQYHDRVQIHYNLGAIQMIDLMNGSDVAILPASGVLYEALCTRCKIISGYYVPNQQLFYRGFLELGAFIDAAGFSEKSIITAMDQVPSWQSDRRFIDGRSPERILKAIAC